MKQLFRFLAALSLPRRSRDRKAHRLTLTLGLARRFQDMQKSLAAICDCAIAIQDLNAQNGAVGDIDAQAAKILALAQEIAVND